MDADKAQSAGIDFKDCAQLRTCWTEDVECDYSDVGRYSGVDALGHYDNELVRTPDGWHIAKRTTHTARVQSGVTAVPQS